MTKLPMSLAEDMQVLHYSKTQHYWAHHECAPLRSPGRPHAPLRSPQLPPSHLADCGCGVGAATSIPTSTGAS